jgi:hypothetical protein
MTDCCPVSTILTILLVAAVVAAVYYTRGTWYALVGSSSAPPDAEHFRCPTQPADPADFLPPPPALPDVVDHTDAPAGAAGAIDGPATDGPAPISYTMGTLDGIRLKTGCADDWRHPPCGPNFASSTQNLAVQGHQLPLVTTPTDNDFPNAPPVDGDAGSPQSMFMLAYNQSAPECCPSTYSTDRGCVCTTPAQRKWIGRGGNWKGGKMGECE